jgi:hypothetical protein
MCGSYPVSRDVQEPKNAPNLSDLSRSGVLPQLDQRAGYCLYPVGAVLSILAIGAERRARYTKLPVKTYGWG